MKKISSKIREIFLRHKVIFFLAILVSLLHGYHHIVLSQEFKSEGKNYYPTLIGVDEKYHTAAKAKQVYVNGKMSGDISLSEYQDVPTLLPVVPHTIMGYTAKAVGGVRNAFMLSDFIFPVASFLLFYFLAFEITGGKYISTFFATLSIIIPRYLAPLPFFTKYYQAWFLTQLFNPQYRLYFNRFEDPLMTVPFFLLALYLIFRTLKRNEKYIPYFAGLSYGFLFYTYFYYSVYLSLALGILAALALLTKRYDYLRRILIVIGVGVFCSVFYWVNFLALTELHSYSDITNRIGPVHTFEPFLYPTVLMAYVQHTVLAIGAFFYLRKRYPALALYFTALLLPVYIVYNIQVITGFNPQPDHWIKPRQFLLTLIFVTGAYFIAKNHWNIFKEKYFALGTGVAAGILSAKSIMTASESVRLFTLILIGAIIFGWIIYFTLTRRFKLSGPQLVKVLAIIAIILLLGKGITIKERYIGEARQTATLDHADEDAFAWLDKNTEAGSVIGTPSFVSNTLIKHFTHNKIFVPDGLDTIASNEEVLNRFYLMNRVFGSTKKQFGDFFATEKTYPPKDEDHEGISFLFVDQYRAREPGSIFTNRGYLPPQWSDEFHSEIVKGFEPYHTATRLKIPYRLDYLFVSVREKKLIPQIDLVLKDYKKEYQNEGVTIYRYQN